MERSGDLLHSAIARKPVETGELSAREEKTPRGFCYVIDAETLPLLAHKASMCRTRRREALPEEVLPSREEDSRTLTEKLTEAVTRLALPVHKKLLATEPAKRTFWQWFTGRS
ncbi:MAG: hypothetical protein ACUVX8_00980 [Candidatus Zipacnadales bacterium]